MSDDDKANAVVMIVIMFAVLFLVGYLNTSLLQYEMGGLPK